MNVLLLGATGHLGGHLADRLARAFSVVAPPRVDIDDDRALGRLLDDHRPEVIVNAIAARPAAPPSVQWTVNAEFPPRLAALAAARHARVVHISTDAVFSGARGDYRETDTPDPIDDYGRAKLAGELPSPHLTIRTSFFGRNARGAGLIEWLVAQHGIVPGFEDYRFSGVAASLLADLIADAVVAGLSGTWHVGGESISKYELLLAVARELRLDVQVVPVERGAVDRTLDSSRFFSAVGRVRPALADSLAALTSCAVSLRH